MSVQMDTFGFFFVIDSLRFISQSPHIQMLRNIYAVTVCTLPAQYGVLDACCAMLYLTLLQSDYKHPAERPSDNYPLDERLFNVQNVQMASC